MKGFARGLSVIKAFDGRSPSLTVTQVAERADMGRAVARRYLRTLVALGYAVAEGPTFHLTPRVLELGFAYLSTLGVADVARPIMVRVVEAIQESCSLAVLDGHEVVYVARVTARRIMTTALVIGSRLPAHATSMGKVLLAYLPPERLNQYFATASLQAMTEHTTVQESELRRSLEAVRRRGWADNDEESEKGVRTIAAPIFDRDGEVIAAVNASAHASRVTMRQLRDQHLPLLLDAAREISRLLGGRHPAPGAGPIAVR